MDAIETIKATVSPVVLRIIDNSDDAAAAATTTTDVNGNGEDDNDYGDVD